MADEEKKKAQTGNWSQLLIGIGAGIAIALLSLTHFYQDLESSSYDFRFLKRNDWFGKPTQLPTVATVDIDDAAVQAHGFPFVRNLHANLVDIIHQYGARIIGFDIFFYEPATQTLSPVDIEGLEGEQVAKSDLMELVQDHDAEFVRVANKTNIVYNAQTFEIAEGKSVEFVQKNLRDRTPEKNEALAKLERFSKSVPESIADQFFLATDVDVPVVSYIESSQGLGFALPRPDHDGIVRRYRLALY
ncbi:MAG: CHASE2 domain-containing protein, partial [Candidatus Latescibacterota bacterium]|nr:CHASE2 domain-containing protein [Candidatus Latescibacterota bacterium]